MIIKNLKNFMLQCFYDSLQHKSFNIALPRLKIITCKYQQYHSITGVYGYKPNKIIKYEVPKHQIEQRINNSNFYRFVLAYREHGHKIANINPIANSHNSSIPELNPQIYGLKNDTIYPFNGILATQETSGKLEDAIKFLENCYCNTLSAEFCHLEEEEEREWWTHRFEQLPSEELESEFKIKLASELLKSEAFDNFLAVKFVTLKRYGGEGAESMMGFFLELFRKSVEDGVQQVLLGLPHRGRLNILTGLLKFPPAVIFRKVKGLSEFPETVKATGDVLSHLTSSVDLKLDEGSLHVSVLYNPSHLEAVNPVSMGKTRARQQTLSDGCYSAEIYPSYSVLNVQVHGDAAFSGQGINQETLAMSRVPHFDVGGSIHLIVNNQLGFTTPGERGRSSRYASDLAKMINAPILHVNGDYPEMVVKATRIAFEYQRKFHKDVFIDLNCFRRWGHNEVDDPTFTNPTLYKIINSRRSVPVEYASSLNESGIFPSSESIKVTQNHTNWLNSILKSMDENDLQVNLFGGKWSGVKQPDTTITTWDTGVDLLLLQHIGLKSVSHPESFNIHPHLKKLHIKNRIERLTDGTNLDWSTAESLAIGSLLYQGFNVRISGQDVGRGTFSHRHVMLIDQVTNEMYIPLNNISESQMGYLEIANSILSEEAVLGFEYGMSIENPKRLVIWEAQFGDFMNGAQIQIDTFISSGETKWMTCSGIIMLLPHGYDGAGPEHSSCRIERFLQLSDSKEHLPDGDDVNMHLVYPTTPAQYFHLLRGQVIKNFRKPLVVVAPKILLRMPEAISSFSDMKPETTFLPVIGDKYVDSSHVQKVIFVTGKHFYELDKYRKEHSIKDVAIVRLEGLCPFPTFYLQQEISKYKKAKSFIWSQEEPQNMGAWSFVFPRFLNQIGVKLRYVGRPPLAAPAVGIGKMHQKEAIEVITQPFLKK